MNPLLFVALALAFFWLVGKLSGSSSSKRKGHHVIGDNYKTIAEVQAALRSAGLESSNLIVGIDYTQSNTWNGKRTFGNKSLHTINERKTNPYQEVIEAIGRTLEPFDEDGLIPAFGFGDSTTKDNAVFTLSSDGVCKGVADVMACYNRVTPAVRLSGPTSFEPLVRKAIEIVQRERSYHILVIVCDGEVTVPEPTRQAIIDAARLPLSIVIVGVGDGPWDEMRHLDDNLPRAFDNCQFVEFSRAVERSETPDERFAKFACAALQEVPEQYQMCRKLGYKL